MQSSVDSQRFRLAEVDKKLTEAKTALADLMSRMAVLEGKTGESGEGTGKVNPKRGRKQSCLKRQMP